MSAPTNRWKLGAFVLGSSLAGLAVVAGLAARTLRIEAVTYTSYFDEAVNGLELGSPVTFRGVKIGNVSSIDIAPDRRHVEVAYSLGVKVLGRLGLVSGGEGKQTKIVVPPGLRVQIASTGVTGSKYLQLDFFDDASVLPHELPFPVPENYIPATPSTMKNLEEAVIRAVNALPEIAVGIGKVVAKADLLLDDVNRRGLPGHATEALASTNRLLISLQEKLDQVPVKTLSRDASAALVGVNHLLERLDGEQGLLASVQRSTDALGDVAGEGLRDDLASTVREVREAAKAIREFLEALDRDPDMLLKGKRRRP